MAWNPIDASGAFYLRTDWPLGENDQVRGYIPNSYIWTTALPADGSDQPADGSDQPTDGSDEESAG